VARAGVASRRRADELIASGAVLVNGRRPPPDGMLVDPGRDVVTVRGQRVEPRLAHRYLAYHKPEGVVTTASDESGRPTVLDAVGQEALAGHRLFPVGRLDLDSSGLLLLTDDGELAFRLTHPSHEVPKRYEAVVAGVPSQAQLRRLRQGVELEDGVSAPAEVELVRGLRGGSSLVRVTLGEGRKRQLRRMLEAVGHPVKRLRRTAFGPLHLSRLRAGGWRVLRPAEVAALRSAAGLGG